MAQPVQATGKCWDAVEEAEREQLCDGAVWGGMEAHGREPGVPGGSRVNWSTLQTHCITGVTRERGAMPGQSVCLLSTDCVQGLTPDWGASDLGEWLFGLGAITSSFLSRVLLMWMTVPPDTPSTPTVTGRAVSSSALGTWTTCECAAWRVWAQTAERLLAWPCPASGADGCLVFHTPSFWITDSRMSTAHLRGSVFQCGGSGPHPYQCTSPCPLAHPQLPPWAKPVVGS